MEAAAESPSDYAAVLDFCANWLKAINADDPIIQDERGRGAKSARRIIGVYAGEVLCWNL